VHVFFLDKEERSGDDKRSGRGTSVGFFASIPHYMKIHDIVKSAYTNYKVNTSSHMYYYFSVFN
jgi:hypothetical protein